MSKPDQSKNLAKVVNCLLRITDDQFGNNFTQIAMGLRGAFKSILTEFELVVPVNVKCSECGNTGLRYADGDWYMPDEPPREDSVFCRICSIEYELTFVPIAIKAIKETGK